MPSKSVITLSASVETKAAFLALSKRHDRSQSRLFQDIANGIIPLQPDAPPPDLRLIVQALQERIEGLEQRLRVADDNHWRDRGQIIPTEI